MRLLYAQRFPLLTKILYKEMDCWVLLRYKGKALRIFDHTDPLRLHAGAVSACQLIQRLVYR